MRAASTLNTSETRGYDYLHAIRFLAAFGEACSLAILGGYSWRIVQKNWLFRLLGGLKHACPFVAKNHASPT